MRPILHTWRLVNSLCEIIMPGYRLLQLCSRCSVCTCACDRITQITFELSFYKSSPMTHKSSGMPDHYDRWNIGRAGAGRVTWGWAGRAKNAATRLIAVINSLRDRRFFYQIDSHLYGSLRIYPNIDAPRHVVVSNMPEGAHGLQNPPMPRRISIYSGDAFPNSGLTIPIGGGV